MKHQPFFLLFLLVLHSFNLMAQPKNKQEYAGLFGRSKEQEYDPPAEQVYHASRENDDRYDYRPENPRYSAPDGTVKIYAVVVGVSQYLAMPPLHFTDDDARLFYTHLKSVEGGALPSSQVTLLLEANATHRNISQALRQMARQADGNDVIIFFFSGHGLSRAFLPIDFDGYDHQLAHEEIFQILQSSRAQHKVCIADACYSGALDYVGTKGYPPAASGLLYQEYEKAQGGIALLMSSSPGEASLEDRALHQGVFTYFLMRGMSGRADFNGDGIVSIKEIFHYVAHVVPEYTSGKQSPCLTGDYDDDMPVAIGE